jgi:hypothetical protein
MIKPNSADLIYHTSIPALILENAPVGGIALESGNMKAIMKEGGTIMAHTHTESRHPHPGTSTGIQV